MRSAGGLGGRAAFSGFAGINLQGILLVSLIIITSKTGIYTNI